MSETPVLKFNTPAPSEPGYLKRRKQAFILVDTLRHGFKSLDEVECVVQYLLSHAVAPEDRDEARLLIEGLSLDEYLEAISALNGTKEAETAAPPLESSTS